MEAEAAPRTGLGLCPRGCCICSVLCSCTPRQSPLGLPPCLQTTQGLPAPLHLTPALGDGYALGCSVEVAWCGVPTPLRPSHHLLPTPSVLNRNSTQQHLSGVSLSVFPPSLVICKLQENLGVTQTKPSREKLRLPKAGTSLTACARCICWLHQ